MLWIRLILRTVLASLIAHTASAIISVGAASVDRLALDVELVGDLAYVADSGFGAAGLQVFDVADPALPIALGRLPEQRVVLARDVEVVGDVAYVADAQHGDSSLRVVDVSDPRVPVEIAMLLLEGRPVDVEIAGALAFVAAREGGLRIVDVSDPRGPFEIASVDTILESGGLAASGSYVYLADALAFRVIDVSDPIRPVEVGRIDTPVFVRDVEIAGNVAYALTDTGMQLIDVSDPTRPRNMSTIEALGRIRDIEFVGDIAYAIAGGEALLVIDISDPMKPVRLAVFDTPGAAQAIAVSGRFAFVADEAGGLHSLDVSNLEFPRVVAKLDAEHLAAAVEVVGDVAYFGASGDRDQFRIFDVSKPSEPVELASLSYGEDGFVGQIVISGDLAYLRGGVFVPGTLTARERWIRVLNVSSPAKPYELGVIAEVTGGIDLQDELLYVADYDVGLRILDVSDLSDVREIGVLPTPVRATDVLVVNDLAYVSLSASQVSALWVVDVSDPMRPELIGDIDLPHRVFRLDAREDVVYGIFQTLQAMDVSDPTAPTASVVIERALGPLAIAEERAFFRQGSYVGSSLVQFDLAAPDKGYLGAVLLEGSEMYGMDVEDGVVYVANAEGGFQIVDFGPEYRVVLSIEIDIQPRRTRNSINLLRSRRLPLALLGSKQLDVRDVDVASLKFGPGLAEPLGLQRRRRGSRAMYRDVNRDGETDLVVRFDVRDVGLAFGEQEACLSGETHAGRPFRGCDAVETLPACGRGYEIALAIPGFLLLRSGRQARRRSANR